VVRGFLGNKEVGLRWFLAYSVGLRWFLAYSPAPASRDDLAPGGWGHADEAAFHAEGALLSVHYTVLCSTVNVADYCWYCWVVSIATSLDFWSWLYVRVYVRSWVPVPEWQFGACKLCAVLGNQWPRWWVGL
jgi:hypothetical protein